jgi:hypothetical protein
VWRKTQRRTGELFGGRVPKFSMYFEEILSRVHGNFEEQNKVLELPLIIIIIIVLLMRIIK